MEGRLAMITLCWGRRLRGDRELPPTFVPLDKGDDKRIVMLEVSYAALGLMGAREVEKRKKYEDTLETEE
eukprot:1176106-Prorocentrum_minimum.AAC.2